MIEGMENIGKGEGSGALQVKRQGTRETSGEQGPNICSCKGYSWSRQKGMEKKGPIQKKGGGDRKSKKSNNLRIN